MTLYLPNYDEQAAMAVNCVRTNGSSCARMSDPSKRSFVTEHGKELNLYPMELSLINSQVGALNLSDETGISVQSKKSISIYAKKGVMFSAAGVHIATPVGGEVKFIKCGVGGEMVSSSFILSNNYDIKTKKTRWQRGEYIEKILRTMIVQKSQAKIIMTFLLSLLETPYLDFLQSEP